MSPGARRALAIAIALVVLRFAPSWWCGRHAEAWRGRNVDQQLALAEELVRFEASDDDLACAKGKTATRFEGEWALVTHQMIALGLAEVVLAHPDLAGRFRSVITRAAIKSFAPEMRDFGTRAWHGEDAMSALGSSHGHAYLAYPALAVGMARLLDPAFPPEVAKRHDALIAAYERRLLASPTGLIETYPNEAYPTDVAAVAAAIAVHGRVTHDDHAAVLAHWAEKVRAVQIDPKSGFVMQRMGAQNGAAHDAPRGSGTALAAYFAGFADRSVGALLAKGVLRHETKLFGFGAIEEYAEGHTGKGDVDSGLVILGVSVSATGFALASALAYGDKDAFDPLYRTTELFGVYTESGHHGRFAVGGPIGNALLLALLSSGPELAP